MKVYVLDDTALLALGAGHRVISSLVTAIHERQDFHAFVPALCLAGAEAQRPGVADHVGSMPALEITELRFSEAAAVGRLIKGGIDWRTAHAMVTGQPTVGWPRGRPVVTMRPEAYDGHQITTIHLKG